MFECLKQGWESLNHEYLRKVVDSMPIGAAERLSKDADILLPIKCCVLRSEIQLYVSTVVQSFFFTKYKKYKI